MALCSQTLRFESYRDLVRLMARGLSEAQGLQLVEQESLERRAQQHAAMQAATDAVYNNPKPGSAAASGPGTLGPGGLPTGSGVYSTIGFSYDTGTGGPGPGAATGADSSSDDSDSDSDSDSDDEGTGLGPVSEAELAQEAEDDRVDEMAEGFGLEDFSYRLHKSLEKEGEDEARMRKPPR
jgi:arginine/serine-rich splicing factor 16